MALLKRIMVASFALAILPQPAIGQGLKAAGYRNDAWASYIAEAAARFDIPARLIRNVMEAESAGQAFIDRTATVSRAGAIGLMQIMPDTYEELRRRYRLGNNPADPRDNILAGTAYLREMRDRFGAPDFLAAYNAGPGRLIAYLAGRRPLPDETTRYLEKVETMSSEASSNASVRYAASTPNSRGLHVATAMRGFSAAGLFYRIVALPPGRL